MGFKRPLFSLTILIMLIIGLTALSTCFFLWEYWTLLPVTILFTIFSLINIRKLYKQNAMKVSFMFDAINNNDYSFKYATEGHGTDDKLVSMSLNRITQILFQAKADAIQREKYYEVILNFVKTGIIVIDDNGTICQSNDEAFRLLGISILTHIKQLAQIDVQLVNILNNIQAGEKKQISISNERGLVTLSLHASEIELRDKHVRIIALNDIKNEMEEKELDSWIRLTRVLTHEIMNSITPITSLSDTMLAMNEEIPTDIKEGLQVISSTGKGLISFVESYRKFTHVPTPKPSLFYVNQFVERIIQLAQYHHPSSNIEFKTDIKPDDLILFADENLVNQVVLNLLKNAMQAIGTQQSDSWILIKAYCDPDENVIMEISNNGPLITPEEAEHIFIPFFTTKENGSGIGLSLSRQIMRVSGGSLNLKNPSSSAYTTFILTFPA